jgi:hypothetical protein
MKTQIFTRYECVLDRDLRLREGHRFNGVKTFSSLLTGIVSIRSLAPHSIVLNRFESHQNLKVVADCQSGIASLNRRSAIGIFERRIA